MFRTKAVKIDKMSKLLVSSKNNSVAVCNANSVVRGARSGGTAKMLNDLTHRICDGYPLSKAINLLYGLNQERVDGFNLFHKTISRGLDKNTKHYFFGNIEEVVVKMIQELKTAEDFLDTDEFGIDDPFYRVFAVYKDNYFRNRKAIGDYYNVKDAMLLIEELTGNPVHIYSY